MIYTVGRTEIYERSFKNHPRPKKKGKEGDYPGGSVWKTKEGAERYLQEGFSVYGVEADWDKDTQPSGEGDWNDLLVTSSLVKLAGKGQDVG